jgi:hypothetical protein
MIFKQSPLNSLPVPLCLFLHLPPSDAASTGDPALVLIDPIPFLLHLPAVAFNFLPQTPWRAPCF